MKVKINDKIVDAKLPKVFKKKWVKALRSGKYKQGTGTLHNTSDDGYCCLGVACRIFYPKMELNFTVIEKWIAEDTEKVPAILKGGARENSLVLKIAQMNDNGKSFKYIASYIDRYL